MLAYAAAESKLLLRISLILRQMWAVYWRLSVPFYGYSEHFVQADVTDLVGRADFGQLLTGQSFR